VNPTDFVIFLFGRTRFSIDLTARLPEKEYTSSKKSLECRLRIWRWVESKIGWWANEANSHR